MKKAFCFDICPCHSLWKNLSSSDFRFSQVTSVEKRKPRKHFSASASGLSLKNLFLGFLFSTSVTWEKRKSDEDKFVLRVARTNFETKYYSFFAMLQTVSNINIFPFLIWFWYIKVQKYKFCIQIKIEIIWTFSSQVLSWFLSG